MPEDMAIFAGKALELDPENREARILATAHRASGAGEAQAA
jgi:hypothetical protein